MSTVLPNTPSQKSKGQMRCRARIMSISRALGQKSQPGRTPWQKSKLLNVVENVYGRMLPAATSPKKGGGGRARARARAPPLLRGGCPLRVRHSCYISIYLYLLLYPAIYRCIICMYTYIYIYLCSPPMINICAFFWFGSWEEGCTKNLQCSKNPEVLGHEVHQNTVMLENSKKS